MEMLFSLFLLAMLGAGFFGGAYLAYGYPKEWLIGLVGGFFAWALPDWPVQLDALLMGAFMAYLIGGAITGLGVLLRDVTGAVQNTAHRPPAPGPNDTLHQHGDVWHSHPHSVYHYHPNGESDHAHVEMEKTP